MEKIEYRGTWVRGDFYNATDVDALLADVRRLVDEAKLLIESAEDSHSHCDCYEVATLLKCSRDTEEAIAAVERHLAMSPQQCDISVD